MATKRSYHWEGQYLFNARRLKKYPAVPAQRSKDREHCCKQWNYSGKCGCLTSDAAFKPTHKCKVCDSNEHAIFAKRSPPIPAALIFHKMPATKTIKNNNNPKSFVIRTELYFALILLNFLKLFPVPVTAILLHLTVSYCICK